MFDKRLKTLLIVLVLFSLVLLARAFAIQVVDHRQWVTASDEALSSGSTTPTTRGRILDVRGRELAIDQPRIDVEVDYRVILFDPDPVYLRTLARGRLARRVDRFNELARSTRKSMIDDETVRVRSEVSAMWQTLAEVSGRPPSEIDRLRGDIITMVEKRQQRASTSKYDKAVAWQQSRETPWYAWLLGGNSEPDVEKFNVAVTEQTQPHTILPDINRPTYVKLARMLDHLPGLVLSPGVERRYPWGTAACHVIGQIASVTAEDLSADQNAADPLARYRADDRIGRTGLEQLLEKQLRGRRGQTIRDAAGDPVDQTAAVPGQDEVTTIDVMLQQQIEEAFTQVNFAPNNHSPVEHLTMPGAAVVIDVASGEVRAMASYPVYDPNHFDELYPKLAGDFINRPLTNRACYTAIEPGSTVKPLIGIGAITQGLIGPTDTIECTGYLKIDGRQYSFGRCWTMSAFHVGHHQVPSSAPHPTGFLTFADALERSCNVYHEELGDRLGIDGISHWYSAFGLGRPTGVGMAEKAGRLPNSFTGPAWRRRAVSWFAAIGQDQVAATPIQMANVAATIARDGIWVRPSLLPRAGAPGGEDRVDLHLNPEAVRQAKIGMTAVVNGPAGTGTTARMTQFKVAAKTGSAQAAPLRMPRRDKEGTLLHDEKGGVIYDTVTLGTRAAINPAAPWYRAIGDEENKVSSHAWMIGFAPAENPKIAFAVMVEYGGGGGLAAGSVVRHLLEACIEQNYLPR